MGDAMHRPFGIEKQRRGCIRLRTAMSVFFSNFELIGSLKLFGAL